MTEPAAALLLGRPDFSSDLAGAAGFVRGRRVLLTGGAGSVGSPLARTLLGAEPASLVVVDHHEHSLFSLERALGAARAGLVYELADIRDAGRLARLFEQHRPELVIHLAAAKHVPYGERFPEGAVAANVLATQLLLELADRFAVERLVYPSSDKSVQPPSVYGATKRLAEALVQRAAVVGRATGQNTPGEPESPQQSGGRRWSIVRFVNIIGTHGSVIETFTQQVLAAQPLSVTDERMTRYWISMDEAVWSLLLAAQCAADGQIVMPACGEPVPVLQTAQRLAGWYRPEHVPYAIVRTGIRPGERLHEVLLSANESFGAGPSPGLRAVHSTRNPRALDFLPDVIAQLRALVDAGDRARLARACLAAAEALQ